MVFFSIIIQKNVFVNIEIKKSKPKKAKKIYAI